MPHLDLDMDDMIVLALGAILFAGWALNWFLSRNKEKK